LRGDDFGAFMSEGWDIGAFTLRVTISVHSRVRGKIPVQYLRDDDFGAFMCEG